MAERKTAPKRKGFGTILGALLVKTYLGRMTLTLLGAAVLCGLDLLAAGNVYERFYWLVGLEFLLFAVSIWVVYIVRKVRES